jgi:5-methylcytosine-specific restriction endonuclease McrA
MRGHLFSLKGVCVRHPEGGIAEEITDEIKEMVMKDHRYFPPDPARSVAHPTVHAAPAKMSKATISLALKEAVWAKFFTNNERSGPCVCCKANTITLFNHHCGHVVAEAMGGATSIDNLRPICRTCNLSMGTRNMDEFQATLFSQN